MKLLSNDILGVSYIAAINRHRSKMDIFPILREGAAYKETSLGDTYPSATALRNAVKNAENSFSGIDSDKIPTPAIESLSAAEKAGHAPVFIGSISSDILSFFKLMSPEEIADRAVK